MKKGFTLVELLVVIVIIGILAAAAISVFGGGTDKAKLNTMKSDVAALHSAGTLALADQGYSATRGAKTLVSNGYLSDGPINPFNGTETGFFYAYGSSQVTSGTTVNPVIYAAGIETGSVVYDKGSGIAISSAKTWTGAPGLSQDWSSATEFANLSY